MKRVSPRRSRKLAVALVAGEEPQADRDLRGVEQLAGQGHHAVHQVGLDDGLADLALARLVGRHGAVGQHETGQAGGGQVVDEVLHPGKVGVAGGGTPYFQRRRPRSSSPRQSLSLNGGLAST